jgi:hypothetical protein
MSSVASAPVAANVAKRGDWAGSVILAVDLVSMEASLVLGYCVRLLLSSRFTAEVGPDQYLGVAAGILLLPIVHYQLGLYPGYMLGPVERLRRRMLATLAVFGGLVAWDNLVARGIFSRGVLLSTLLFVLVLTPLAETVARGVLIGRGRWGIPVVMLGAGDTGRAVARTLIREPQLGSSRSRFWIIAQRCGIRRPKGFR